MTRERAFPGASSFSPEEGKKKRSNTVSLLSDVAREKSERSPTF